MDIAKMKRELAKQGLISYCAPICRIIGNDSIYNILVRSNFAYAISAKHDTFRLNTITFIAFHAHSPKGLMIRKHVS